MIQVTGYTTKDIMARAGITRDAVSKWGRQYAWGVTKIGTTNVYNTQDVDDFFAARLRRDLMKAAGWTKADKLIWSDTWDRECPKCGSFAVERPAKPGEVQSQEWLAGDVEIHYKHCGLMPQKAK